LTPGALTKRVVRIDNIKSSYNSSLIEGLITSPIISGYRLYHGEASRPNTLTFVLTGNVLRFSRDISERSFIIQLARPVYKAEWEDNLYTYLTDYHDFILADIVAELRKPGAAYSMQDRYAEWIKNVLARSGGDTDAVVGQNQKRRNECDEELEDATVIMEAIDEHVSQFRNTHAPLAGDDEQVLFITSTSMVEIIREALKEKLNAKAVKCRLEQHVQAGRLPRVKYRRSRQARGYDVYKN